ncbi:ABC transporter substrate-binding protein [Roseibium sp. AS2]|uniref:ABC transporter substrate-binding protein n=1 Tax=Roseibium sp. AS2 TaxID=3135781 RepID=UPI00317F4DA2
MTLFRKTEGINRRKFLAGASVGLAAPAILTRTRAYAADPIIRIGHVSPRTGPLAGFAEADDYVLAGVQKALSGGIENNGKTYQVEIISKDSQSNPNRAAEVASELILGDEVDIIVGASTPDTTNPVSDQAELNEVPCITTDCPWQPYFFGRNGDPATGFDYTYHFFWGLEDVIKAFLGLWEESGVERKVGGLFPNDADGNAWGDDVHGFPPALVGSGFELTNPGRYQPLTDDFSSQISAFKAAGCEILTGNMISPDFATFWSQAAQQGFAPKVATLGKALLFPSFIESLGDRGDGLTSEIWWTPDHPFSSSLTGMSAKQLADGYTASSGRPWTQPIGFKHALFEVTTDVIRRSADLDDPNAILESISSTDLATVVGHINWGLGPVKNVSKTPLVAGQWQKGANGMELVITSNHSAPEISTTGTLKLLG